jgi:hypothetical protein
LFPPQREVHHHVSNVTAFHLHLVPSPSAATSPSMLSPPPTALPTNHHHSRISQGMYASLACLCYNALKIVIHCHEISVFSNK